MTGLALADEAADEAAVNNGTLGLVTEISGTLFTADQSVSGTGFANTNNNLAVLDPDDNSRVLYLRVVGSGSGYYSHNSSITVVNNTDLSTSGEFASASHSITAKEDTSAVYAPISFQFPGSFRTKTIKSLWKDRTYAKNYAGMISMNSLFDDAKTLNKVSTTTLYSDNHKYEELTGDYNSSVKSSMDINSKFDGLAHLGATISDVKGGITGDTESTVIPRAKANENVLVDEDYRGSFSITKKMAVDIEKTIDYGYYEANYEGVYEDYPWLPCACNLGWDDMAIHDTRYHSAKGFFDCMTCLPPAPCKN
jgi:hypothetical protein